MVVGHLEMSPSWVRRVIQGRCRGSRKTADAPEALELPPVDDAWPPLMIHGGCHRGDALLLRLPLSLLLLLPLLREGAQRGKNKASNLKVCVWGLRADARDKFSG